VPILPLFKKILLTLNIDFLTCKVNFIGLIIKDMTAKYAREWRGVVIIKCVSDSDVKTFILLISFAFKKSVLENKDVVEIACCAAARW
jgi:hypothetical protein